MATGQSKTTGGTPSSVNFGTIGACAAVSQESCVREVGGVRLPNNRFNLIGRSHHLCMQAQVGHLVLGSTHYSDPAQVGSHAADFDLRTLMHCCQALTCDHSCCLTACLGCLKNSASTCFAVVLKTGRH